MSRMMTCPRYLQLITLAIMPGPIFFLLKRCIVQLNLQSLF